MSAWSPDFEKKLIEAHRLKETLPACPPPCHGPLLVTGAGADSVETMLKCTRCGTSTTYRNAQT
jgi:hypothetical protein